MTFPQIAKRVASGDLTETEIDEYRRFCASWLFTLNATVGNLLGAMAVWLTQHRQEYKSQAEAERAFEATEHGQRLIQTKYRIRGIEALVSALEGTWFLRQREWKESQRL